MQKIEWHYGRGLLPVSIQLLRSASDVNEPLMRMFTVHSRQSEDTSMKQYYGCQPRFTAN